MIGGGLVFKNEYTRDTGRQALEAVLLAEVLTVIGLVGAMARRPWHDAAAGTRLARAPGRAGGAEGGRWLEQP